jgi:hypothetical protein
VHLSDQPLPGFISLLRTQKDNWYDLEDLSIKISGIVEEMHLQLLGLFAEGGIDSDVCGPGTPVLFP